MKKLFLSLYLGLFLSAALACTPGAGNGPSGDPNCMGGILNTDPYYNNSGSSQNTAPTKIIRYTTVNVPSKYGALAFDKKTGSIGGALNSDSLAQAKKMAVKQCGGGSCKVITWVRNGCIAAVSGKLKNKLTVYKAAENPGHAEEVAMNRCQSNGASDCKVIMPEGCSIP